MALYTNTATLDADTTAYTTTGEVVASGYTAGGKLLAGATVAISNNVAYITFSNPVWTAALTARGALIYNTSQSNKSVAVLDFGSDKTSTNSFTVQMPANTSTSALIRLT